MMRAESSLLELIETADGVAIAAPFREIAVWCQAAIWPVRHGPTRPQEVIDFEELLSELITMARMLH